VIPVIPPGDERGVGEGQILVLSQRQFHRKTPTPQLKAGLAFLRDYR
jgi:hypothetical protein